MMDQGLGRDITTAPSCLIWEFSIASGAACRGDVFPMAGLADIRHEVDSYYRSDEVGGYIQLAEEARYGFTLCLWSVHGGKLVGGRRLVDYLRVDNADDPAVRGRIAVLVAGFIAGDPLGLDDEFDADFDGMAAEWWADRITPIDRQARLCLDWDALAADVDELPGRPIGNEEAFRLTVPSPLPAPKPDMFSYLSDGCELVEGYTDLGSAPS